MLLLAQCWERASPAGHMQHLGTWMFLSAQMGATFCCRGVGGLQQHCYTGTTKGGICYTVHAGWQSCSKLSPSIFSSKQSPPPYSSQKAQLLKGSCFGETRLQLSYFSQWGCWDTELGVIFNNQNRADVPLDWFCVVRVVPPTVALYQEVHGGRAE